MRSYFLFVCTYVDIVLQEHKFIFHSVQIRLRSSIWIRIFCFLSDSHLYFLYQVCYRRCHIQIHQKNTHWVLYISLQRNVMVCEYLFTHSQSVENCSYFATSTDDSSLPDVDKWRRCPLDTDFGAFSRINVFIYGFTYCVYILNQF